MALPYGGLGHHIRAVICNWGHESGLRMTPFLLKLSIWPLLQKWFKSSTNICDIANYYLTYWEKSELVLVDHNSLSSKLQWLSCFYKSIWSAWSRGRCPWELEQLASHENPYSRRKVSCTVPRSEVFWYWNRSKLCLENWVCFSKINIIITSAQINITALDFSLSWLQCELN